MLSRNLGGVYLDTDVEIIRPIEDTLTAGFICGVLNLLHTVSGVQRMNEDGIDELTGMPTENFGMQTGLLYSEPNHPFVTHCMKEIYGDGQRQYKPIIIDLVLIRALKEFAPDFRFRDETQHLDGDIVIYNSHIYTMRDSLTRESVAIHWYDQSWMNYNTLSEKLRRFIRLRLYFLIRRKRLTR